MVSSLRAAEKHDWRFLEFGVMAVKLWRIRKKGLLRKRFLARFFSKAETWMNTLRLSREDFFDKLMGCWLGKNDELH
jgi:hypothetical protein